MSTRWQGLLGAALVLALAFPGWADEPFEHGEVFAGIGGGRVTRFSSSGAARGALSIQGGGQMTGMCFDLDGNLYATSFSSGTMAKFDKTGQLLSSQWGGPFSTHAESCVVDKDGNVFTGEVDGQNLIRKFDPDGKLLASFSPRRESRGLDWIDLAADQRTMFYTSEGGRVLRFDVRSDRQLDDFVSGLEGSCYALRVRENGEVMVACQQQVYRLSRDGSVVKTYPIAGEHLFGMNLDPDDKHFWTGGLSSGNVYKVHLETGQGTTQPIFNATGAQARRQGSLTDLLGGLFGGGEMMGGLAVYGERTAAVAEVVRRQDEDRQIEEVERRRQARVVFGPPVAIDLGRVAPEAPGRGALDLTSARLEADALARVSTDLAARGVVLELETEKGWRALGYEPIELPIDLVGLRRWTVRARVERCLSLIHI